MILIGVDPGLVTTGLVMLDIDEKAKRLRVWATAIEGTDSHAAQVADWVGDLGGEPYRMVIESYRPRGNSFTTDPKMQKLLLEFKLTFPKALVLDNTGMKSVVKPALMQLLHVWNFSQKSHHQDLRSAARIALYGALKDDDLNPLMTDVVTSLIDNTGWEVLT